MLINTNRDFTICSKPWHVLEQGTQIIQNLNKFQKISNFWITLIKLLHLVVLVHWTLLFQKYQDLKCIYSIYMYSMYINIYIYIYIYIYTTRILIPRRNYRNLVWVGLELTTNEFRSELLPTELYLIPDSFNSHSELSSIRSQSQLCTATPISSLRSVFTLVAIESWKHHWTTVFG